MKRVLAVSLVSVLAACSGGDDETAPTTTALSTTAEATTSTVADCDVTGLDLAVPGMSEDCRTDLLTAAATILGVDLTADAVVEAKYVCGLIESDGISSAAGNAPVAWQGGERPTPTVDPARSAVFIVAAVQAYCPERYADLESL